MIDLHIHTNCSDGTLTPKEVIDEALKNNVKILAIADHDTIDAYTSDLFNYASSKGIQIIPAVEISTKYNKVGIHILGYNIDINNKELKDTLYNIRNSRHKYLQDVSIKLKELGYIINIENLSKIESVTKAHIANDVITNNKNELLLLKEFNHLPTKGEFIETIMNEGCPAYVEKETITPQMASSLIKSSGGKVVLAHPVAYQYEDNLTDKDIITLLQEIKADGLESYYIYIDRNNNKINEIDKWNKIAKEYNLIATIGSDFHTKDNIHPQIGLINENIKFNYKKLLILKRD